MERGTRIVDYAETRKEEEDELEDYRAEAEVRELFTNRDHAPQAVTMP
jgi:hypothetical protein